MESILMSKRIRQFCNGVVTLMLVEISFCIKCSRDPESVECCPGYRWNITSRTCTECMAGYRGINCSRRCRFPTYGEKCQSRCECNESDCDVSSGCPVTTVPATTVKSSTLLPTTVLPDDATSISFKTSSNVTLIFDGSKFDKTSFIKRNLIELILVISFGSLDIILLILYICTYKSLCCMNYFNQHVETVVSVQENNHYEDIEDLQYDLTNQ